MDFLLKHYSVILSLAYLCITVIGMFYSYLLYIEFGINVFDYFAIGDFLLAALKNPGALLFEVGAVLLIFLASVWPIRLLTVDLNGRRLNLPPPILHPLVGLLIVSGLLVLGFVRLQSYAEDTAQAIKDGDRPSVEVRYNFSSGSAGQVTKPGLELIGATQKAVFFYDVDGKRTFVIPQAQIASIEVPH